jgi:eukaryotic-like serine/threonine-protein kinase
MNFPAGTRLGPYEILSPLGAGGMGEVHKALDTRLNRTVAIKVLLPQVSARPELQARFEREAQTVAALNHPHICTLHDIGHHEGAAYLVMEYLDGGTLADRIARGPLPLNQTLKYAIEIADALDKAHRLGVTHRDLKPSNIMLTKSGAKLVDFGLAKLKQEVHPASSSLSGLPTNAPMTGEGMILGTLQYMAPEQLEGKDADARTDIFALGAVIYEMLTGRRAFESKSQASLIAAILEHDPLPISTSQPMLPRQLDHIVMRCLAKEPDRRWQTASDLQYELQWVLENPGQPDSVGAETKQVRKRGLPAIPIWMALGVAAIVGFAVFVLKPSPQNRQASVIRLTVSLPPGEQVAYNGGPPVEISSRGDQIVYVSGERLYLRNMSSLEAKSLEGTEGASSPFFSPDGQWVAFFAQGKLKKTSLLGGTPQTLSDAPYGSGGTWASDGTIYFSPSNISGISKVASAGGTSQAVTTLDRGKGEVSHRWPQILPGNKAILFTTWTGPGWDEKIVELLILGSGERRVVVRGGSTGRYVSAGYIVYAQGGNLMAVPFDVSSLQVTGSGPLPLNVQINELGEGAAYAVSDAGVFCYLSGDQQFERRLAWVDRKGNVEALPAPLKGYENASISPDGKFAAVQTNGPMFSIWIYDFSRTTLTPFTSKGSSQAAAWTPDGKHIAYRGTRSGFRNVYWKASDGTGEEERLTTADTVQTPVSWSPDGKRLVFTDNNPLTGSDAWVLSLDGDRKSAVFEKNATAPRFSPDGRWIVYSSEVSGRPEIYVRPFQSPGGKTQVSTGGGTEPVWSRDGKELFYLNGDKTMAVDVTTQPSFSAGTPHALFAGHYLPSPNNVSGYDVAPDGKHFLKVQATRSEQVSQINVVINWFEELKRLTAPGH